MLYGKVSWTVGTVVSPTPGDGIFIVLIVPYGKTNVATMT